MRSSSFYLSLRLNVFICLLLQIRCQDVALRKEYVALVESVKVSGGDIKIFSSLHVSGEREWHLII